MKKIGYIVVILIVITLIRPSPTPVIDQLQVSESKSEVPAKETIYVQIAGAVENAGLYEMASGSRVNDLLEIAKPTSKANLDCLNLAQKLVDEQKLL